MNKKEYCVKPRGMSGASLLIALVIWVLLAPMVKATTPQPGDGDTNIKSDGSPEVWLAWCKTGTPPYDCHVSHEDGTDVYVTMTADWLDQRSYPSEPRTHWFYMKATYGAADYTDYHDPVTYGGNVGGNHLLSVTVPNVGINTYMTVLYNASIIKTSTGEVLAWYEGSSLFHFVP